MSIDTSHHPQTPVQVSTLDKLSFTVFLAIALHALLIFGVSFNVDLGKSPAPTLEVTLATHKTAQKIDQADFLAQHDQQASGTEKSIQEVTTDQLSPFNDVSTKPVTPLEQVKARTPQPKSTTQVISTRSANTHKARTPDSHQDTEKQKSEGRDPDDIQRSSEIASLIAKLDSQRQTLANRPRVSRQTSVSTKTAIDATYINQWESKVTVIGNRNFPEEALRNRIFGSLRLATTINPNGTIKKVEITQSSGEPVLDNAALQIVHQAAPFDALPPEILKDYDLYEIIRTWHFEISGLSTSFGVK